MKRSGKVTRQMKCLLLLMPALLLINFNGLAHADWSFGIGTGIMRLNADGDMGFHTNIAGPVEAEVDLDPDDFDDLMESAFGLAGYATNGKWMIQYSFGKLKLEDNPSGVLPGGETMSSEFGFDITSGEFTVGYFFYRSPSIILGSHIGGRYTKHELDSDITIVSGLETTRLSKNIDEKWTDVLFGISADIPLAEKWTWNNRFNAGFGGSEGTYFGYTGITWRFLKNWSASLYGQYTAIEYENGSKGDPDWYLYDVNEFGLGISGLFHW